jgi:hypothetical protein
MRIRVVAQVGIAVLALPVASIGLAGAPAFAAEPARAPATLTPLVARDVAFACPGTERYAEALVGGITESDAAAAAPLFDACAAAAKHAYDDRRRHLASTAVGAAYLSLALLRHDPALLRRSIDATDELHRDAAVSDDEIRRWPIIPDDLEARRHTLIVRTDCPAGSVTLDAAYLNVAAHAGFAWAAPRAPASCPPVRPDTYLASRGFRQPEPHGFPPVDYSARPNPAWGGLDRGEQTQPPLHGG